MGNWREELDIGNLRADKVSDKKGNVLPGTALRTHFGFVEDFIHFTDGDLLVVSGDATPDLAEADGHGGVVTLAPDAATDNLDAYIATPKKSFKFQANKPLSCRARLKLTEANTDDASIAVGFSSNADAIVNGGGPQSNYSGAMIFKVDGGTVWQAETSNGTTQNTDTDCGAFSDGSWADFEIVWDGRDNVRFYINDKLVSTQALSLTSIADMFFVVGVKNGSANLETLHIDYVAVNGKR